MTLPRAADDVVEACVDVERERSPGEQELVLLRAVEDRIRVAGRLVHVPRCRHERGEHDRDESGDERRLDAGAIDERGRYEDDDRDSDHPERPGAHELPSAEQETERDGELSTSTSSSEPCARARAALRP